MIEEDYELLFKYVIKLYGQDLGANLIAKYQNNLWGHNGLAYCIGRESLSFFCEYFLQETFRPKEGNAARKLAPFHFELWNTLQDMFVEDSFDKLGLVMPRGSSKTTTCDFALTVWAHCYKVSIYTLVAGKTEQDATEFVRNIRRAFEENAYIIGAFGELINSRKYTTNNLELELTNGTKVQAISSTSSMRGKKFGNYRPTLIIADDYQGKADVLTQEARDKKYNTWVEDVSLAGDKAIYRNGKKVKMATKFVVLGTLMHKDCFMSRLLKDDTYKHVVKRAVDIDDVDTYFNSGLWGNLKKIMFNPKDPIALDNAKEFYYQHKAEMQYPVLWPDKYDCLDLAINDYYPSPSSFRQEMQNDVTKVGERAFHMLKTMPAEEIEANTFNLTVLAVDPAVETGKNNDFTALAVAGKTDNNFEYIRKGIIERLSFDQYIDKVIKCLECYEDISYIWVEKNTFSGSDVREIRQRIAEHDTLKHRHIEIINQYQKANKENKIRAIGGKVDSGFIIFNEEDTAFNEQVLNYEGELYSGGHDDAPDCVAEASRLLETLDIAIPKVQLFKTSFLGL